MLNTFELSLFLEDFYTTARAIVREETHLNNWHLAQSVVFPRSLYEQIQQPTYPKFTVMQCQVMVLYFYSELLLRNLEFLIGLMIHYQILFFVLSDIEITIILYIHHNFYS